MPITNISNKKKNGVMSGFVSSMLSTASILTAINASMINTVSNTVKRETVNKSMKDLSSRAMTKAVGMQNTAFESITDIDPSKGGVVGSMAYLLSSGLFALSTVMVDEGIVSSTNDNEFRFLSKEQLESEVLEGARSVLDDVTAIDSKSFGSLVEDLKLKREQTIRSMYEIYTTIEKHSGECDAALAYMDIIRNTYNYSLACVQSCVKSEDYKFSEDRDTDSTAVSVDIPIPIRLKPREFTSRNLGIIRGELGRYVELSYNTVNHLVNLTEAFVVNHIQSKAFAHFITVPNSFAIFINGKRYAVAHDDVIESFQNFKDLLFSNYSPVYERAYQNNQVGMDLAVYNNIPAYIDHKIELSRSGKAELAVLDMDERYMKDRFESNAVEVVRQYEHVKASRSVLLDFAGQGGEVDLNYSKLNRDGESIYDRLMDNWQSVPLVPSTPPIPLTYSTIDHDSMEGKRSFGAWELTVNKVLTADDAPFDPVDKSDNIKKINNHILNRLDLDKPDVGKLLKLPSESPTDTDKPRSLYELYQDNVDHFKNSHIPGVKKYLNTRMQRTVDLNKVVVALLDVKKRMIDDDVILSFVNEMEQLVEDVREGVFMPKLGNEVIGSIDGSIQFNKLESLKTLNGDVDITGFMTILLKSSLVTNNQEYFAKYFTLSDPLYYNVKDNVDGDMYYYEESLHGAIEGVEDLKTEGTLYGIKTLSLSGNNHNVINSDPSKNIASIMDISSGFKRIAVYLWEYQSINKDGGKDIIVFQKFQAPSLDITVSVIPYSHIMGYLDNDFESHFDSLAYDDTSYITLPKFTYKQFDDVTHKLFDDVPGFQYKLSNIKNLPSNSVIQIASTTNNTFLAVTREPTTYELPKNASSKPVQLNFNVKMPDGFTSYEGTLVFRNASDDSNTYIYYFTVYYANKRDLNTIEISKDTTDDTKMKVYWRYADSSSDVASTNLEGKFPEFGKDLSIRVGDYGKYSAEDYENNRAVSHFTYNYPFYIENYYPDKLSKLGVTASGALEVYVQDYISRVDSLILELQLSINKTRTRERSLTSAYDERVTELMDNAQEIMSTVSNINKTKQTITDLDDCVERARVKVNEIVNIRNHLQPLHADDGMAVSYKN